ncbi:MAG: amidohydrolase family protein [Xanthobacteraceae bacterium]
MIRAGILFDGRAYIREDVDVEVRNGKITAVRPASGKADIDLGKRLLAPGLIDTHVHLSWYITSQERLHRRDDGDDERTAILNAAGNAWRMLQAGFTTVQSVGAAEDKLVRDAIDRGAIPGPRVLTSLGQVRTDDDGGRLAAIWSSLKRFFRIEDESAEGIRSRVRTLHASGADLIKIFATENSRRGGASNMTQTQLDSACGEARSLGLRAIVHAQSAESMKRAVRAGCTQIDHGRVADDESIAMMASAGVYFEPQCSLVFRNYLGNWHWFADVRKWDAKQQAAMERILEGLRERAATWLSAKSLKVVYGSDAVAGAHGQNAADLVCRVRDLGQPALDALRSATSLSAESLGLGDKIGTVAPGYEADLVAFEGDPRQDPGVFMQVAFVMRGGVTYRLPPDRAGPNRVFPSR